MGINVAFDTNNVTDAELNALSDFVDALKAIRGMKPRYVVGDGDRGAALFVPSSATETVTVTAPLPPAPTAVTATVPAGSTVAPPSVPATAATATVAPPPPVAPTATATVADSDERDTDGLPWDERIHSSNHKKAATGKWMRRKGVSDQLFTHIVAELRARVGSAPVVAQAPAAPAAPVMDAQAAFGSSPVPAMMQPASNVVPMVPAAPVAPAAPAPQAPLQGGVTFQEVMQKISALGTKDPHGKLAEIGITDLKTLIPPGAQNLRDMAMATLTALG